MRRRYGSAVVAVLCAVLTGCDGSDPRQDPPSEAPGTSSPGGGQPSENPGDDGKGTRPGVGGSPIRYDGTLRTGTPESAEGALNGILDSKCGPKHCGVKVVFAGKGDCIRDVYPNPVQPGGTITIARKPCPKTEEPPPTSDSETPAKTRTSAATQTSTG